MLREHSRTMRDRIDKLLLLWRTLVWLKPVQIYGRIWLRLYRPKPRQPAGVQLVVPSPQWRRVTHPSCMSGPETFTFLNRTQTLASSKDWNAPNVAKLWLYNAHYFDDLNAAEADQRTPWHRGIILRWIAENPPGFGNGWEPYPTSLRIVNWAKWLMSGNPPPEGMADSLAMQADWLSRRLEHHLLGNHLFANAKALVFAGCLFTGPQADRWLATGLRLLTREMPEQILPDGGHFERSIMYHAILTEDVLDLIHLAQLHPTRIDASIRADWQANASRMLHFLQAMTHPDGQIAFFNDGAFGIAAHPEALIAQGKLLEVTQEVQASQTQHFPDTGYSRLVQGPATLFADTAPIGPDYLPGHAHADTLSFELSLDDQRIFVNGGTSVYGGNPQQRMRERSTSYHNTVCINDVPSSEIWSDFRVALRAKPFAVDLEQSQDAARLVGSHDGYDRISGPRHKREWALSPGSLIIHDSLDGTLLPATARFRIHPDLAATSEAIFAKRRINIKASNGTLTLEPGEWSPEFGKTVPCQILTLQFTGAHATIRLTWEP